MTEIEERGFAGIIGNALSFAWAARDHQPAKGHRLDRVRVGVFSPSAGRLQIRGHDANLKDLSF